MRLNFAKTFWWWQFGCSDGWTSECITQLGWDVKVKSMQEAELLKICVGCFILWLKPNWEVPVSILHPSKVVISFWYQPYIFALKSIAMCSKLSSKFLVKLSSSSFVWLGDLYRLTKLHVLRPILTSKLIHSLKVHSQVWGNFWQLKAL